MGFIIPSALRTEHEELHDELVCATKKPGNIGEAARAVAKVLHFRGSNYVKDRWGNN
jgi:hypothetical protein